MKTQAQTKKSKRNYIIVALIVVLLLLGVGYAAFSETLTISGTAEGTATWDVHFESGKVEKKDDRGDLITVSNGDVSADGHTLTLSATDLAYPGDARVFEAVIENSGTLDAKVTGFTVNSDDVTETVNSSNKTVTVNNVIITFIPLKDDVISANDGKCTYRFVAQWDPSYSTSGTNTVGGNITFTIDYTQDAEAVTLTPAHND